MKLPYMIVLSALLACTTLPVRAQPIPMNLRINQYDEELVQLEWEIKTLNLINGLYLSADQLDDMLDVLEDLVALNDRYIPDMTRAQQATREAYRALRDDLLDGDLVDPDTERRAAQAKHRLEQLVLEYSQQVSQLETGLFDIFTDKQRSIADEFAPCIVPPQSDNNVRIGQTSGSNPRQENLLQRLREMSVAQLYDKLPEIISRYIDQLETKHGMMSQKERDEEFDRLYDLALEVRELSDVEFELRKSELAAELQPQQLRNKWQNQTKPKNRDSERPKKKYQLSTVGSFLLNENLIPILEKKLEAAGG